MKMGNLLLILREVL